MSMKASSYIRLGTEQIINTLNIKWYLTIALYRN